MTNNCDVIVIGGGASGMMAAGIAAKNGKSVILIEKNDILGKKLLITGKGRCNITNSTDIEGLINNVPINGNFLYSAFYSFSNDDLVGFFNELGVETKVERGQRVFPLSDKAADVVFALKKFICDNNVKIINIKAKEILLQDGKVLGVLLLDDTKIFANSVIIATGGMSYQKTGSTGDGYKFAAKCGHTIIPPRPSLVPLETKEMFVPQLQGLSLRNIEITIFENNKKIYSEFGEMLFTHFGVSGPVILSASSHIRNLDKKKYVLSIDLKPALSLNQLDKRIQRDFEQFSRKEFSNSLGELLPQKLIPIIIMLSGINSETKVNQITKEQRINLANLLKNLNLEIKCKRPIEEAIITSGGINVSEINPSTMESKKVSGLYFAGEVVDVDAYTGGFNLQIAFSTGYLAGINAN